MQHLLDFGLKAQGFLGGGGGHGFSRDSGRCSHKCGLQAGFSRGRTRNTLLTVLAGMLVLHFFSALLQ
jgi:hypothetical protein